jgi:hypothetical protein
VSIHPDEWHEMRVIAEMVSADQRPIPVAGPEVEISSTSPIFSPDESTIV